MKYRVLDDIAFHDPASPDEKKIGARPVRTAKPGDVVELGEKDAAALTKRGAVQPLADE